MMRGEIKIGCDANDNLMITGSDNQVSIVIHQYSNPKLEQDATRSTPDIENPFIGLACFQASDSARFFGRDNQIKTLWNKLRDLQPTSTEQNTVRLLPVLGPSGCGKSSLVRAGLIPELVRNPLPGLKLAQIAALTPGSRPLESLACLLYTSDAADE